MTVKETFDWGKRELAVAGVSEPEASAEFLMLEVLKVDRAKFYTILNKSLTIDRVKKYQKYIERRKNHEPVWQIVGKAEFWGMEFFVNQSVLVPRPETELLVEKVLDQVKSKKLKVKSILDIGTGSGAIATSLAKELSGVNCQVSIVATDISEKALKIAKKNAEANSVADVITFVHADLFKPFSQTSNLKPKTYDLITANLPYIPTEDMKGLALDIHHYEPRVALSGGSGGLVIYERFLKQIPEHINPGGMVFCEIGKGQGKKFRELVKKYLPKVECQVVKDLAGFDRIVKIRLI